MEDNARKTVLTITGSDSTSGSGVQADILTVASLGGYAVSAITSITLQNTLGIQRFYDLPAETVVGQIEAIVNDVQPQVVKVGMIRSTTTLRGVVETLRKYAPKQVIYDPVLVSTHGELLMPEEVMDVVRTHLLPLCTLVTITKSNAEHLLHGRIETEQDVLQAVNRLLALGADAVLLRGGNMNDRSKTDVLVQRNAMLHYYSSFDSGGLHENRHGMSGNLSSAIAAYLCENQTLDEAVAQAYYYLNQQFASHTGLVGRASELYNDFVGEVSERFATNRDVRYYAEQLNVSSRYLAQVTKRIAGKTPKTIIDDHLKKEAENLLLHTDKTVQEVAYALGFSSQAHFTKFFRKGFGCTPSDFRRSNR